MTKRDSAPRGRVDFTAHELPVLAVPCPTCRADVGARCLSPSGHKASHHHRGREVAADLLFVQQHGEDASIERTAAGWVVDPSGRRERNERDRRMGDALSPRKNVDTPA